MQRCRSGHAERDPPDLTARGQPRPDITGVAYAGDAWIRAIEAGLAERNPYVSNSSTQIDLRDSDVNAVCCTTPIG